MEPQRPQRADLLNLVQQCYQQYCLSMLSALDNPQTRQTIAQHGGSRFQCDPLVYIGQVAVDNAVPGRSTYRDCYLAPGFPIDSWVYDPYSAPAQATRFARNGDRSTDFWGPFVRTNSDVHAAVSLPRYLCTMRTPGQSRPLQSHGLLATFRNGGFSLRQPKVWSPEYQRLESDVGRIGRGDNESWHVSYSQVTAPHSDGNRFGEYTAVICSAIVHNEYAPGTFRPWNPNDALNLPWITYRPQSSQGRGHLSTAQPQYHRQLPAPWSSHHTANSLSHDRDHDSHLLSHRQRQNYMQTLARGNS